MHLRLGADLEVDALGGALGVVGGLRAGLDVGGDAVVVRRGEEVQVVETLESDGVLGRAVANSRRVLGDPTFGHVVRRLGTSEEAVATDDGVRGEGRALRTPTTCVSTKVSRRVKRGESDIMVLFRDENAVLTKHTLKTFKLARACAPGVL